MDDLEAAQHQVLRDLDMDGTSAIRQVLPRLQGADAAQFQRLRSALQGLDLTPLRQFQDARRQGVPEETITAIRENHSRGISPEDAEIVEFTRQLLRKHRIDEATAASLRKRFGDQGFIELTGAIGYYSMLAMTVNACELEAAPNAEILQV